MEFTELNLHTELLDGILSMNYKTATPIQEKSIPIILSGKDLIGIEVFIILFSICFHHYDNLYRAMQENKKPDWLKCLGLWVEGRILIIGLIVMAGWSLWWLAWYFGLLFLGISSIQWVIYRHTNKVRQ